VQLVAIEPVGAAEAVDLSEDLALLGLEAGTLPCARSASAGNRATSELSEVPSSAARRTAGSF
jgi:hypothetical protein